MPTIKYHDSASAFQEMRSKIMPKILIKTPQPRTPRINAKFQMPRCSNRFHLANRSCRRSLMYQSKAIGAGSQKSRRVVNRFGAQLLNSNELSISCCGSQQKLPLCATAQCIFAVGFCEVVCAFWACKGGFGERSNSGQVRRAIFGWPARKMNIELWTNENEP
jgi:hypothetical protein